MKVKRTKDRISLDFSLTEARALLEELSDVPGGSKLPKLRQICVALGASFSLVGTR